MRITGLLLFFALLNSCGHKNADPLELAIQNNNDNNSDDNNDNDDRSGDAETEPPGNPANEGAAVLNGPAKALLIDGSVHTGTDWNGVPYEGVWGEPFDFKMADYPVTWAIAVAHASLLLQSRGIPYSPNAVLSVALKESRLGCLKPDFPNDDGCFQIESTTAYAELRSLFSGRFNADHSEVISKGHFESSALASVYYTLFSMAMFHLHHRDPLEFFAQHPHPQAMQKVINAAYNRGLWWEGLEEIFTHCADREVTECFVGHQIAIDHANAIADYTKGLDAAEPFDAEISVGDLQSYWESIRKLYPDVNEETIQDWLSEISGPISFHSKLKDVLENLIARLPPLPTHEEVTAVVCGQGYLWASPPCP